MKMCSLTRCGILVFFHQYIELSTTKFNLHKVYYNYTKLRPLLYPKINECWTMPLKISFPIRISINKQAVKGSSTSTSRKLIESLKDKQE